ncbi:TlpA family protein disulfide reductase [Ureibacillus manganicus]|uniref:Thiol-disulfide oxidoreductase n=1 Tax=Ureibacillus manganicus DSM 26584 TaxID=1384049 RepID=A0A0A3J0C2_9BACL|nr:redoxin domain-containing protein [Ureibacillus manganicus]KGR80507.1 thiol-disulfide oxidoreductase [Ureibacillus manganicus DSM 26584]
MKLRSPLPKLSGPTTWINGEVKREQLIGDKATLVHFWSVSCYYCKESMSDINKIRDQYKDILNVISVHMPRTDEDTYLANIKEMAKRLNITQPILVDNEMIITNRFDNQIVPAYYLFDEYGVLRHYQAGESGMRLLENRIKRILNIY